MDLSVLAHKMGTALLIHPPSWEGFGRAKGVLEWPLEAEKLH